MKGNYIFLADGFEEVEALATLDILRRGGVDVKTVSIYDNSLVEGAHCVQLIISAEIAGKPNLNFFIMSLHQNCFCVVCALYSI